MARVVAVHCDLGQIQVDFGVFERERHRPGAGNRHRQIDGRVGVVVDVHRLPEFSAYQLNRYACGILGIHHSLRAPGHIEGLNDRGKHEAHQNDGHRHHYQQLHQGEAFFIHIHAFAHSGFQVPNFHLLAPPTVATRFG